MYKFDVFYVFHPFNVFFFSLPILNLVSLARKLAHSLSIEVYFAKRDVCLGVSDI